MALIDVRIGSSLGRTACIAAAAAIPQPSIVASASAGADLLLQACSCRARSVLVLLAALRALGPHPAAGVLRSGGGHPHVPHPSRLSMGRRRRPARPAGPRPRTGPPAGPRPAGGPRPRCGRDAGQARAAGGRHSRRRARRPGARRCPHSASSGGAWGSLLLAGGSRGGAMPRSGPARPSPARRRRKMVIITCRAPTPRGPFTRRRPRCSDS